MKGKEKGKVGSLDGSREGNRSKAPLEHVRRVVNELLGIIRAVGCDGGDLVNETR